MYLIDGFIMLDIKYEIQPIVKLGIDSFVKTLFLFSLCFLFQNVFFFRFHFFLDKLQKTST